MVKKSNIVLKKEEEDLEVVEGEIIDENDGSGIELKTGTNIRPYTFFKTIGKIGSFVVLLLEAGSALKGLNKNKKGKERRRKRRKNENIFTGKRR